MTHLLDDRFKTGIWYDMAGNEFCKIDYVAANESIVLIDPDEDAIYFEMPAEEFEPSDFKRVPDSAVDDPAGFLREYIDEFAKGMDAHEQLTFAEEVGLRYANQHTTIENQ